MAKPNWTRSEEKLLAACKEELNSIIAEWSAEPEPEVDPSEIDATDYQHEPLDKHGNPTRANFYLPIHLKDRRMVDRAIVEMWRRLLNKDEFESLGNFAQFEHQLKRGELIEKQAYHDAVDAYFRIYRGRKRGRPTLGSILLGGTAKLANSGATVDQIALESGLDPKGISNSTVRKRVKKALIQERK